ncbi:hypothetical protein KY290_014245 [Solanum tuberosum]|uniref:Uncharacterized protein n=1 Tax=Solanum tuberosum TaxID=4113 RepID=A0ABQ7VR91_SOLTU|nr:hypothetical protein KY289_014308 [Solanum tuberosum]KAH0699428.1 hypothetical protein KY284_013643 [Solanum tuberosum]KAH0770264.1 hypothetical protein KY290_014245 [Solanum tuberosum]
MVDWGGSEVWAKKLSATSQIGMENIQEPFDSLGPDLYAGRKGLRKDLNHRKSSSITWKNIKLGWGECKDGLTWILINFWFDAWIPNSPPLRTILSGPLPLEESIRTVDSILNNRTWYLDNIPFQLPPDIVEKIQLIHTPNIPILEDKPTWSLDPKGSLIFLPHLPTTI